MATAAGIDRNRLELRKLSEEIWKNPELNYEEHTAHKLLTDFLEEKGFTVERGYCGMQTAFRARQVLITEKGCCNNGHCNH